MKKILIVSMIVSILMGLLSGVSPLNFKAVEINNYQLEQFYESNGVSEEVSNELIEKVTDGEILESDTGEGIVIETEVIVTDESYKEIDTYTDMSISVFSVSGGTCGSGSGYSYCTGRTVSTENTSFRATFKVDYQWYQTVDGPKSKVTKAYNGTISKKIQSQFEVITGSEVLASYTSGSASGAKMSWNSRVIINHALTQDNYYNLRVSATGSTSTTCKMSGSTSIGTCNN